MPERERERERGGQSGETKRARAARDFTEHEIEERKSGEGGENGEKFARQGARSQRPLDRPMQDVEEGAVGSGMALLGFQQVIDGFAPPKQPRVQRHERLYVVVK